MSFLVETTLKDIAKHIDNEELGERIVFSTADVDFLERYNFKPCDYNTIVKANLIGEEEYSVVIGRVCDGVTISKDINLLTNGDIEDKEKRITGIYEYLLYYYDNYCKKNDEDKVYFIMNWWE